MKAVFTKIESMNDLMQNIGKILYVKESREYRYYSKAELLLKSFADVLTMIFQGDLFWSDSII